MQTYKHTNTQTYKHTNNQTYKHTNIKSYKHKNIQHTIIYIYLYFFVYVLGPWAGFEGEAKLAKPTPEEQEVMDNAFKSPDDLAAARGNKKAEFDEKSTLHSE